MSAPLPYLRAGLPLLFLAGFALRLAVGGAVEIPGAWPDRGWEILAARAGDAASGALAPLLLVVAVAAFARRRTPRAERGLTRFLDPLEKRETIGPWAAGAGLAVLPAAVLEHTGAERGGVALLGLGLWLAAAGRHQGGGGNLGLAVAGVGLGLACAARDAALLLVPAHLLLPLAGYHFRRAATWAVALMVPALVAIGLRVGLHLGAPVLPVDGAVDWGRAPDELLALLFRDTARLAPFLGALAVPGALACVVRPGRGRGWLLFVALGAAAAAGTATLPVDGPGPQAVLLVCAGLGLDMLLRPLLRRTGRPPAVLVVGTLLALAAPQLAVTLSRILGP